MINGITKKVAVLAMFTLALTAFGQQAAYEKAMQQTKAGQWSAAIPNWDQVINKAPKYSHAYLKRGTCYLKLKKYNNAAQDLNAALTLFIQDGKAQYANITRLQLAQAYLGSGKYAKITKILDNLEPQLKGKQKTGYYQLMSQALIKQGKFGSAIPLLEKLQAGGDKNATTQLAYCYDKTGQGAKGIDSLRTRYQQNPSDTKTAELLVRLLSDAGRRQKDKSKHLEAAAILEKLVAKSGTVNNKKKLATQYQSGGQYSKALSRWHEVAARKNSALVQTNIGKCTKITSGMYKAIQVMEAAKGKISSKDRYYRSFMETLGAFYYTRGLNLNKKSKFLDALQSLQKSKACFQTANKTKMLGKVNQAIQALNQNKEALAAFDKDKAAFDKAKAEQDAYEKEQARIKALQDELDK